MFISSHLHFHCGKFESTISIFFNSFWLFYWCPTNPLYVLGIKSFCFPTRACGKILLLVAWVLLVLPSTKSSRGMLTLKLWFQASPQEATPKTTSRQERALFKMVQQDPSIGARGFPALMRNLYGIRAGWTIINNRLLPCGYHAYRPTRKPLLTANHRRLYLEWAQRWQNLTMAHLQHICGDESRFQPHR